MRFRSLSLATVCAVSVAVPASAQVAALRFQQNPPSEVAGIPSPRPEPQTKPEVVVARLMSFDQNHDGRVTRAELPERMQTLLARDNVTRDEGLDANDVQRLAERPAPQVVVRGFQAGHYGFGEDSGIFDSRLHIEGAIEDLRLAGATREKALSIGRTFADAVKAHARADLFAVANAVLTPEQLDAFTAALEQQPRVPEIKAVGDVQNEQALRTALASAVAKLRQANTTRLVAQFPLDENVKQQLQAALEQFKAHDRLGDTERSSLLEQLRGLLTDQEHDDLRAALERRPIVKQGAVVFNTTRVNSNDARVTVTTF